MQRLWQIVLATVLVLVAGSSAAQDVLPGSIALGLVFDAEQNVTTASILTAASVEAYLVITEATVQEIAGWELKITIVGDASITAHSVPVGTTLTTAGPENWAATLAAPLPANPRTKLASFTIYSSAQQDVFLFLGPMDGGSVGGTLPAVRLGDGSWHQVNVPSGDPTQPVAGIDSTTPTEHSSWGAVKGLFR